MKMLAPNRAEEPMDERLLQARDLVTQIELGNEDEISKLIDSITKMRERDLFKEVGKLTRELHDTLKSFRDDSRLESMMKSELPDAKERLNYVVSMTEQAAHRTMNAIDKTMPIPKGLGERAHGLSEQWRRFLRKQVSYDEFQQMIKDVDQFFQQVDGDCKHIQTNLNEVYMAQDFQDLTGQVIRKVINLVHEVEHSLVGMIRLSGDGVVRVDPQEDREANRKGHGHAVPGVDDHAMTSQDDVDDLLSSLGF